MFRLPEKRSTNHDYLPGVQGILDASPSRLNWIIPTVLSGLVVTTILWLWLSEVDVVSPSSGVVISNSRLKLIQPQETSVVESILVSEGEQVSAGQPLVIFDRDRLLFERDRLQQERQMLEAKAWTLQQLYRNLTSGDTAVALSGKVASAAIPLSIERLYAARKESYDSEMKSLDTRIRQNRLNRATLKVRIEKLQRLIPLSRARLQRVESMIGNGMVSKENYDAVREELIEKQSDLEILQAEVKSIETNIAIARQDRQLAEKQFIRDLLEESVKVSDALTETLSELNKLDDLIATKTLTSPIDGVVNYLTVNTTGGVVQSGDVIMKIVPGNEALEVEARILNRDIGFIELGQRVKVKVDSFSFTKYGYIEGNVKKISNAATKDELLGEIYTAIIELASDTLDVNGRAVRLLPGMTCTVDIRTGKRRIIEYIISPFLRYQDEALRER